MKRAAANVGWIFCIIVLTWISLQQSQAPPPRPDHPSLSGFSTERVNEHLRMIARSPHPTGTDDHARVRTYLMEHMKQLGLELVVQSEEVIVYDDGIEENVLAVTVTNVMARLEGASPTRSVVLMSHYDTESYSPGANDDGVAVAAMLETMHAFVNGEQPRNDVIFLFTDAEELGMLGATAFWNRHELARDAGVVLNFEARGSSGASLMFETSEQNGWIIEHLAAASTYSVASSLMSDVKKLKSNDTDLSVSNVLGYTGLNFAYVDGWIHYHQPTDNLDHVDQGSLFHHSLNMYELAKHFSREDITYTKAEDNVYFTLFGTVIHYSKSWSLGFTVAAALMYVMMMLYLGRKKRWSVSGLLYGAGAILISAAASAGAVYGLWRIVSAIWADRMMTDTDAVYEGGWYYAAFLCVTLAISILAFTALARRASVVEFSCSLLGLTAVGLTLSSFVMPGATYVFSWTLVGGSIGLFVAVIAMEHRVIALQRSGWLLFAAPAIILAVPILYLALLFMDMDAAPLLMALIALALAYCWPLASDLFQTVRVRYAVAALLLMMVTALGIAASNAHYSNRFPQVNNLFYTYHTNTDTAYWVSKFAPDPWTERYVPDAEIVDIEQLLPNRGKSQRVWIDEAPSVREAGPQVSMIAEDIVGEKRTVRLKVTSPRMAKFLMLQVENTQVEQVWINGQRPMPDESDRSSGSWRLKYINFPDDGIELTLVVRGTDDIHVRVLDGTYGLPEFEQFPYVPRPDHMAPAYGFDNMTMIVSEYQL